jgi:hypothetical protein
MLQFYGIELVNDKTGEVKTAANFETRFKNLEDHPHNNLRLTRILTSLGHLGFWRFKQPLVTFFKTQVRVSLNFRSRPAGSLPAKAPTRSTGRRRCKWKQRATASAPRSGRQTARVPSF